jgi:hypothetical protein
MLACLAAGILLAGSYSPARAQDDRVLTLFEPARGRLDDQTPLEEWTFDGSADQVISLLAVTTSGDLDPVLELIGPDGARVAQNDDLDSLVRDAGIEAFTLPQAGTYTVRVMRYLRENGETSGEYRLTLTSGFALLTRRDTYEAPETTWLAVGDEPATLMDGQLRLRVSTADTTTLAMPSDADPVQDLYLEASARVFGTPSYAEAGLVVRAQADRSYRFKVNTEGEWTALLEDPTGIFVLRSWSADPALAGTAWTLAVLARADTLAFYANGTRLGTLQDNRLIAPGTYGVLAATRPDQPDPAVVLFDNILVTQRLGTTYQGPPLALTTWDSLDPNAITGELAAAGQIVPAEQRDMFIPETRLSATDPGARFELLGSEQARYTDFLLSGTITVATTGESVGCGLVYGWLDEANFSLAYVDTAGGFGATQTQDSALTTNVYDFSSTVRVGEANRLLVLAQGNRLVLYINGALVTQETVAPAAGRIGIGLLNYEDVITECYFTDIWVWPLITG